MLPQSVQLFLLAFAVLLAIDFRIGASAVTLEELSNTVAYLREGDGFGTGFFVLAEHPFLVAGRVSGSRGRCPPACLYCRHR